MTVAARDDTEFPYHAARNRIASILHPTEHARNGTPAPLAGGGRKLQATSGRAKTVARSSLAGWLARAGWLAGVWWLG